MSEPIITNSFTQAVAQNHFDSGKKYFYRIVGGGIQCRICPGEWEWLTGPYPRRQVKNIAADNNRLFILTTDNKLYWRCLKPDAAHWVRFLYEMLEGIGLGRAIGEELIWPDVPPKFRIIEGEEYPTLSTWAAAYRAWTERAHDGTWNELARGINGDDIVDIAVGNWNNTVVTYYVLLKSGRLMYLDEEPLMQRWEEVPGVNRPVLDEHSRITASHSVIAASKGDELHWIRFDAHQPMFFNFGPLSINWTEVWYDNPVIPFYERANHPGWHSVKAPGEFDEFLIDVGCGAPWPVPRPDPSAPVWPFRNFVASYGTEFNDARDSYPECGFLGCIDPAIPRSQYPVCCTIRLTNNGTFRGFLIFSSSEEDIGLLEWRDITRNICSSYVGNTRTKEVHRPLCRWGRRIRADRRRSYDSVEEAISDGYNGCHYCLREIDTD